MSHFSELKTQLKNRSTVISALKKMGFEVVEAEAGQQVDVRGYFGESQKADFKILTRTHYDIGFRLTEGNYEVVGDWELLPKVSKIEQEPFLKSLKKEYAMETIYKIAEEKGYEIETQETESGTEVVVKQW